MEEKKFPEEMLATSCAADILKSPSSNLYLSLTAKGCNYRGLERTVALLTDIVALSKHLVSVGAIPNSPWVLPIEMDELEPTQKYAIRAALEYGIVSSLCPYLSDKAAVVNTITGTGVGLDSVLDREDFKTLQEE